MISVAILGAQLVGQLENDDLGPEVRVAWKGTDTEAFRREVPRLKPDVVVIDLAELQGSVDEEVRSLFGLTEYELGIVTYSFARRQLLKDLRAPNVRVLQAPMRLDTLRAHLMPLVVRSVLEGARAPEPTPESPGPFRYTRLQLGKLVSTRSQLACECPNHVAQLVESLQQFELYSKSCANKDEADAAMHQRLALLTGRAREVMEGALAELLVHEKISV